MFESWNVLSTGHVPVVTVESANCGLGTIIPQVTVLLTTTSPPSGTFRTMNSLSRAALCSHRKEIVPNRTNTSAARSRRAMCSNHIPNGQWGAHGQGNIDRKSVVWGKSVDLGGRRIIKKKQTPYARSADGSQTVLSSGHIPSARASQH